MDEAIQRAENARDLARLRDEITLLAGHLNAANYRFLKLIAEFDRREGWVDNATQSCAHWLNWQCGIDLGAAREKVRVARALEDLPKISEAMERGEISYSNVRAITRVACEATEDYFLQIAHHGTAEHVERMVRHYRNAKAAEELSREAKQQIERTVTYSYDADGSLLLRARLPAEAGALVLKALELAMNEIPFEQVDESLKETRVVVDPDTGEKTLAIKSVPSARRADALALMAESFLQYGATETTGGEQNQIIVHVSAETLRDSSAGCCEFEDGPSISAESARRLSCDAGVIALIEDENGEPLSVGRKTRTISSPLRRFLKARDNGCRFPGCANTRHVDAHHIKHWSNGGETKPSNLVSLCGFHHRKVHEGGIEVQMLDDGAVRFVKRDGTTIDSRIPTPSGDWIQLPLQHEHSGIHINPRTAVTRWDGVRCNYGMGVESLLNTARRAKAAASEERIGDDTLSCEIPEPASRRERYEEIPFDELDHSPGASIARWRQLLAEVMERA